MASAAGRGPRPEGARGHLHIHTWRTDGHDPWYDPRGRRRGRRLTEGGSPAAPPGAVCYRIVARWSAPTVIVLVLHQRSAFVVALLLPVKQPSDSRCPVATASGCAIAHETLARLGCGCRTLGNNDPRMGEEKGVYRVCIGRPPRVGIEIHVTNTVLRARRKASLDMIAAAAIRVANSREG